MYGQCQSYSPQLVLAPLKQSPPNKWTCMLWNGLLVVCPVFMGAAMLTPLYDEPGSENVGKVATLMIGVFSFAILFAINSAVHSYLVVKYADVGRGRCKRKRRERGLGGVSLVRSGVTIPNLNAICHLTWCLKSGIFYI